MKVEIVIRIYLNSSQEYIIPLQIVACLAISQTKTCGLLVRSFEIPMILDSIVSYLVLWRRAVLQAYSCVSAGGKERGLGTVSFMNSYMRIEFPLDQRLPHYCFVSTMQKSCVHKNSIDNSKLESAKN
jgi:hypothetical protein